MRGTRARTLSLQMQVPELDTGGLDTLPSQGGPAGLLGFSF